MYKNNIPTVVWLFIPKTMRLQDSLVTHTHRDNDKVKWVSKQGEEYQITRHNEERVD